MLRSSACAAACALVLALSACGGGDGTSPASFPAALVGHWQAGAACKAAGCAISARIEGSNLVLPLTDSVSVDLQIASGGSVVSTLSFASQGSRIVQGLAHASGSTLVIEYPTGTPPDTVLYAFDGTLLHFDFQNSLQLPDVTGDGIPDRLRMSVIFVKR